MDNKLNEIINRLYNNLSEEEKEERFKKQKQILKSNCKFFCIPLFALTVLFFILGIYIFFTLNKSREIALFAAIPGILFMLILAFLIFRTKKIIRNKEMAVKLSLKSEARKKLIEENIGNFTINKELILNTADFNSQKFLIDINKKQFVFYNGNKYSKIIQFKDVLNYEVYEDGKNVIKGTAGKALIGGAFFGLAGAIVGSSSKRKINNYCSALKLLIRINDIDSPLIEICFIKSACNKDSLTYKNCVKSIQETCALLEFILNNNITDNKNAENDEVLQ